MSVVGIDLGTTNTVVGCVREGKVHVLADEKGVRLLPSVVSFHPNGEVLVGSAAKARRIIDAKNTIYSHKRLIGRSWSSAEISQARKRLPFDLREGPGQGALVHARGQDYTLPEISAFVLKRARQIAEQALGTPVERAVITVPAHFNELQRASTKVAGRVSGVEVLRILNEPTAAALAYGLGRSGSERVAVYDFGGGTFDCTLLDLNGNVFEVLATAGDSFLGGDDIDNAIADRMAEAFLRQHRQDVRQDATMFERLKTAAEELKIALSTADSHTVTLRDLGHGARGAALPFQFTLARRDLDAITTPLIERSFKVTQDALSLARLSPSSFDKVILVGGSTRMPLLRQRVEGFFGKTPLDRVNPDEVVAIGAAIQAAALTETIRKRSIPPRTRLDTQETTKTSDFNASMLKPAFGAAPSTKQLPPSKGIAAPTTQPFAPFADNDPETLTQAAPGAVAVPDDAPSAPDASIPSFPSMSAFGSAPADPLRRATPEGPFGALADLSLVSTSGVSTTGASASREFGHVSDLSLIGSAVDPREMETQARPLPFDLDDPVATEPAARGNTVQVEPRQNPVAPPSPKAAHDALLDRQDLPAVAARPKPARLPGQTTKDGRSPMTGRPPPMAATQPFAPMAKAPPPPPPKPAVPKTAPFAAPPPPPPAPPPLPPESPRAGPNAYPLFASQVPPPAAPSAPYASAPSAPYASAPPPFAPAPAPYGSAPPPAAFASRPPPPYGSAPPPAAFASRPPGTPYASAPPPAPFGSAPPPAAYASAPPPPATGALRAQPFAFGSAPPPPPTTDAGPFSFPPAPNLGQEALSLSPAPYVPYTGGADLQSPAIVDVTPRGLVVETAGGYCDTIIQRNSKIPSERTRKFATGRDMQTSVRVRVAQGESTTFAQNTYLGEVELSGLRAARRGEVTVAVTFEVDADGTLRIRARDVQTGQEARATLQLIGVADESSVVMMINRFAQQPLASGSS